MPRILLSFCNAIALDYLDLSSLFLSMKIINNPYVQIHVAVLLWGFTAILGDLISLSAFVLVWWRVGLTALLLLLFPGIRKGLSRLSLGILGYFSMAGFLLGMHWLCFYGAIKLSNASVALVGFSTMSFFTAFIEPVILGKRIRKTDVILGIAIIPGLLIVAEGIGNHLLIGLALAVLSALLLAVFAVLNKQRIDQSSPLLITFIEMTSAWAILTVLFPIFLYLTQDASILPSTSSDVLFLGLLCVACTIFPFFLQLSSLKKISAFSANLAFNMEPIYGIVLAAVILKDHHELNSQFYIGSAVIVALVVSEPILQKVSRN